MIKFRYKDYRPYLGILIKGKRDYNGLNEMPQLPEGKYSAKSHENVTVFE
ncbi:MAG: hypothetical protein AB8V23_05545 [Candidatus Midichloria sp.]